jgi:hypothetical protein
MNETDKHSKGDAREQVARLAADLVNWTARHSRDRLWRVQMNDNPCHTRIHFSIG